VLTLHQLQIFVTSRGIETIIPPQPQPSSSAPAISSTPTQEFTSSISLENPSNALPTSINTVSVSSLGVPSSVGIPDSGVGALTPPSSGALPSSIGSVNVSSLSSPNGALPGTVTGAKPVGAGGSSSGDVGTLDLTDAQKAGVKSILRACYGEAMSLSSDAQLSDKQAQELMGRTEKCSQNQFEEQLAKKYQASGMNETDAKLQAHNDLISVLDYQNETSMTPEQRINMNMNNPVSLYTGATDIKDWKEAREKIRNVNRKYQECEKNNDSKYCKKFLVLMVVLVQTKV
jgi:hypothetical protein